METERPLHLAQNVKIKMGYENAGIYDFNNKAVYLVHKDSAARMAGGEVGGKSALAQTLAGLRVLTDNPLDRETDPLEFSYGLFDDAYSYQKCRLIYFEVSNFCNYRCLHCYANMQNGPNEFMGARQAEQILRNVGGAGACDVRLTGGEPFVNPEIDEIMELVAGSVVPVNRHSIATNGSFSAEQGLKAIGMGYELQVSIYGMTPETFHRFTGAGAERFEALMEKLSYLSAAGASSRVVLAMSVSEVTYGELPLLTDYAKGKGFGYVLNRPASVGRAVGSWDDIQLNGERQLAFAKVQNKKIPSYCYHLCQLFWTTVKTNGDVVPCPFIRNKRYVMGNVCREPFETIWNCQKYQEFRALTATDVDKCKDCEFCYVCTAGCCAEALDYSGGLLEVYPWCEVRPYENSGYLRLREDEVVRVRKYAAGIFDFESI